MTDKELLQRYIDLAPFLSKILGEGTEVVIHDVNHPKRSLVAIENSLSGRKLGSPITAFAKELVEKGTHTSEDFVANYNGSAKGLNFLSSTYFIKNNKKLIGLLCINKNISASKEIENNLIKFLNLNNLAVPSPTTYHEELETKVEDFIESRIAQTISLTGVEAERLSIEEKKNIVNRLNDMGLLKVKGAIEETAKQLFVSVPTIYRYIKK